MIKQMMINLSTYIRYNDAKEKWRTRNKHNNTIMSNFFDINCVSVGNATYGKLYVHNVSNGAKLTIGNYCSIADGVVFIPQSDHNTSTVSTFPFKRRALYLDFVEAKTKGDIIVGDDVWIGENAIILSGVTIHQGAVISAGAVVSKDIPPYCIVGGVPAKTIKRRFSSDVIDFLLTLDYSKLDYSLIGSHLEELYSELENDDNIDTIRKRFNWFPKKI